MVIARKIKKGNTEKFISKGGKILSSIEKKGKKSVLVYIPISMLDKIERLIEKRIGISRHTWILEALDAQIKCQE